MVIDRKGKLRAFGQHTKIFLIDVKTLFESRAYTVNVLGESCFPHCSIFFNLIVYSTNSKLNLSSLYSLGTRGVGPPCSDVEYWLQRRRILAVFEHFLLAKLNVFLVCVEQVISCSTLFLVPTLIGGQGLAMPSLIW